MTFSDFETALAESRLVFKAWSLCSPSPSATERDLALAEVALGVSLPQDFRRFLLEYGGGQFGFGVVYTATPSNDWSLVERNRESGFLGSSFLAISDNSCGDFYGFCVQDQACDLTIRFADHDLGYLKPEIVYPDFLTFVTATCLSSA